MIFWKLGLRNIFRNKRRTAITAVVIGVGWASLIITDAFILGMSENLIKNVTSVYLGEGNIQNKDLKVGVENTLQHLDFVEEKLNSDPSVEAYALRTQSFAMISSAYNVVNVGLIGIESEKEKQVSKITQSIYKGEGLNSGHDIIIGKKMADLLEVGLGDKVVVSVAQAQTGEMSQELFFVKGLFDLQSREMNSAMAFIPLTASQKLLHLPDQAHEIVIQFHGAAPKAFLKDYSWDPNIARTWRELAPAMASAVDMSDFSIGIVSVILFVLVLLSVTNTLLMSLYERIFEFGVIKALGTRPFEIAKIIIFESIGLTFVGTLVGGVFLLPLMYWLTQHGVDYSGIEMGEVTFNEPIYAQFYWNQFVKSWFLILSFVLLATLYPIIHLLRIKPAVALRKSL